jgi:hypothetical protein
MLGIEHDQPVLIRVTLFLLTVSYLRMDRTESEHKSVLNPCLLICTIDKLLAFGHQVVRECAVRLALDHVFEDFLASTSILANKSIFKCNKLQHVIF